MKRHKKLGRGVGHSSKPTVVISRNADFPGSLPPFIHLAHRQFEKTVPPPLRELGTTSGLATYQIPVDLVRMVLPTFLADDIEAVELTYRKRIH